jgi:hypothetical protein
MLLDNLHLLATVTNRILIHIKPCNACVQQGRGNLWLTCEILQEAPLSCIYYAVCQFLPDQHGKGIDWIELFKVRQLTFLLLPRQTAAKVEKGRQVVFSHSNGPLAGASFFFLSQSGNPCQVGRVQLFFAQQ